MSGVWLTNPSMPALFHGHLKESQRAQPRYPGMRTGKTIAGKNKRRRAHFNGVDNSKPEHLRYTKGGGALRPRAGGEGGAGLRQPLAPSCTSGRMGGSRPRSFAPWPSSRTGGSRLRSRPIASGRTRGSSIAPLPSGAIVAAQAPPGLERLPARAQRRRAGSRARPAPPIAPSLPPSRRRLGKIRDTAPGERPGRRRCAQARRRRAGRGSAKEERETGEEAAKVAVRAGPRPESPAGGGGRGAA